MSLEIPDTAVCKHCGYALRGLADPVCPECGNAFDPSDPDSFRDKKSWQPWRARFASPPKRWHCVLAILLAIPPLWEISNPGWTVFFWWLVPPLVYLNLLAAAFVTVNYLLRAAICFAQRFAVSSNRARAPAKRRTWRWAILPLCVLMFLTATQFNWPMYLRFRASLPAFKRMVDQETETSRGRVVGLYWVDRIERYPNGQVFFETGGIVFTDAGFVFSPDSSPVGEDQIILECRLADSWFLGFRYGDWDWDWPL